MRSKGRMSTHRPLRIAMLTSAPDWRGSAVSFVNIARALRCRGHVPILLAGSAGVTAGFSAEGLSPLMVEVGDPKFRSARLLSHTLRDAGADVLLVDMPHDLRLGALASLATPVALINRYNCSRSRPPRDIGVRLAYERVRLTIFLTQQQADQVTALAPFMAGPPARVIPEGIDLERFHPDSDAAAAFRRSLDLGDRPFLLAVGSLSPEKRYHWLLQSLALLGTGAPPLVICGEGPLRSALEQEAAELNLDVHFAGFVTPLRLVGAYSAASCLVHACAVETFGLSVVEAMACGLPLVAMAGGAIPEVTGETGVLVPPEDPKACASALSSLLIDPPRRARLAELAQVRARTLFALETMGGRYAEAIESVA